MYLHFSKSEAINEISNGEDLIYNFDKNNNEHPDLKPLGVFKKVNLFVGSNNSGKSRFLRSIIKSNNLKQIFISDEEISFKQKVINYKSYYGGLYQRTSHVSGVRNLLNDINKNIKDNIELQTYNKIDFQSFILKNLNEISTTLKYHTNVHNRYKPIIEELIERTKELIKSSLYIKSNLPNLRIYIPILRSLHENEYIREGQIKETIKKNYGLEKDVFTGLEIHKKVHDLKTTGIENRRKIKKFESFLSKNFFSNKEVEITGNIQSNQLLFSISGEEYPVHNLGDGIQSLILLLFPIYTANENDWFFIEEPETNLHPGLQRVFLETLINDEYLKSKNLKFFFTTHSNHFLDTSIQSEDISIFQFKKTEDNSFFVKSNVKPEKEVLDILGVNSSSVFLSNTSIWVEGPTDRKYISKFLKLFCNHKNLQPLKEDIDFAFFEYGGNLIEHYLFDDKEEFNEEEIREKINSFALSNKIYLLADNDNANKGSKKDLRRTSLHKLSNENDNFTYQNTELKEIENLLPKKVIQDFMKILISKEESQEKSQKIKFKREDYKNIGLGEFYINKFKNFINKNHLKSFNAESGSLKNDYKIKLASFVVYSDYTYLDLIEDNKELDTIIESLYNFITK